MADFTPMMQQYFKIKEQYADTILFYRLGDFYEMFFDDARTASRELELCLTGRNCGSAERAPMCGVPYHAAESYISKLVSKGYKVAVCEQIGDPKASKGIVDREIVRVYTPGTLIETSALDESRNNFLAGVFYDAASKGAGVCFADVSTGELYASDFCGDGAQDDVVNELSKYSPRELLLNYSLGGAEKIRDFIDNRLRATVEQYEDSHFDCDRCAEIVTAHFSRSLEELELDGKRFAVSAVGVVLEYLKNVQKHELVNMSHIEVTLKEEYMRLDASARANLELCESQIRREKHGSLLWVLDYTKTPMGKRLIRQWITRPLVTPAAILLRQTAVGDLVDDNEFLQSMRDSLADINDIERVMTKIAYGTVNARELRSLAAALEPLPEIKRRATYRSSRMLRDAASDTDTLEDIRTLIDDAIVDEPPIGVREGGMIRQGFNAELDSLRETVLGGKGFLADIELREQQATGIKKLRIGYNRVFGYYIEVLNSYKALVPDRYIRKQTLSNCERYITPELKELESKVLGAQERIVNLEYEIFSRLRNKVAQAQHRFKRTSNAVARLDALCSFAVAAVENGYVCPDINSSSVIDIKDGRHPVVEKSLSGAPFVPNDTYLDNKDDTALIITGPNMAGKSTYMRQTALIVIMAQIGSFVPASSASIGIVDAVFTRIGASDDLAAGQSTFMLEMSEVASILKYATSRSLIILDEVGRGTATYDGMSIARAVLEHIACKRRIGAKTLFATHYHELTALEGEVIGVKNYNTSVKKRGEEIIFLRRIVRGCADGSFGIEVARLAGIPERVVTRAGEILTELESGEVNQTAAPKAVEPSVEQLTFDSGAGEKIAKRLRSTDLNTLTPIEALTLLYELKSEAGEE